MLLLQLLFLLLFLLLLFGLSCVAFSQPFIQYRRMLTPLETVDATQSSTFLDIEQGGFNISYVDGSSSSGDYFQDTFSIGGSTLKAFQMGLATESSIAVGIMGIGYNTSEANVDTGNGTVYANLPQAMQNAGLINANAYSLWLNDLRKSSFVHLERGFMICIGQDWSLVLGSHWTIHLPIFQD